MSNLTYKMFILGFEHGRKSAYLSLYYHEDMQLFYVSKTFVGLVSTSKSISLDEAMSSNLFSFATPIKKYFGTDNLLYFQNSVANQFKCISIS